jgi:archaemetzincin
MPSPRIETLEFVTVGSVPSTLLVDVVARVSRAVALPCRLGAALARLEAEPIAGRVQIDADRLLADAERCATRPGAVLVALAAPDMGTPLFTHFFGRARIGGRALVVSVARLSPAFYGLPEDAALVARRACLEVVHELGHVAGLRHCADSSCLMHLAHNVEAVDLRGTTWCPACAALLPRELREGGTAVRWPGDGV